MENWQHYNLTQLMNHHLHPHDFMDGSKNVNQFCRAKAIEFQLELHHNLENRLGEELKLDILFRGAGILDRIIYMFDNLQTEALQDIATTSLWIACKCEDSNSPDLPAILREMESDTAEKKTRINQFERKILQSMNFNVMFPTIMDFLHIYSRKAELDEHENIMAQVFAQIILFSVKMMKIEPRALASLCVFSTLKMAEKHWTPELMRATDQMPEYLEHLHQELLAVMNGLQEHPVLGSVFSKYN